MASLGHNYAALRLFSQYFTVISRVTDTCFHGEVVKRTASSTPETPNVINFANIRKTDPENLFVKS